MPSIVVVVVVFFLFVHLLLAGLNSASRRLLVWSHCGVKGLTWIDVALLYPRERTTMIMHAFPIDCSQRKVYVELVLEATGTDFENVVVDRPPTMSNWQRSSRDIQKTLRKMLQPNPR